MKVKNIRRLKQFGLLTIDILEVVFHFAAMGAMAFNPREFNKFLKYGDYEESRTLDQVRRLIKTGYLESFETDGSRSIKLTKKGRIKLIENTIDKQIDGKWRMLSFDVPEKMRALRDSFRLSIKRIGFKQVQKSLWACPYVHAENVEMIIEENHLERYVAYMIVEKTDIEPHLRRLFSNEWGELE